MIQQAALTPGAQKFLTTHSIGVLSTLSREGEIQGRAVYYVSDELGIYILTKTGTAKMHDIYGQGKLAFTVYDENTYQTIQVQGTGEIVGDQARKDEVFRTIMGLKDSQGNPRMIPITSFHEGGFVVIRIVPTAIKFTDFQQKLKNQP